MLRAAAATEVLNRELKKVNGKQVGGANSASKATRDLDRDVTSLGRSADRSGASIDKYSGRLGLLANVAGLLGPSLVPIGTIAVPALTGLAAQFGFAAVGAGTALAAFQGVGDALKAMNKAQLEPTTENLQAAQIAMEGISPAARGFVRELRDMIPALKGLRDTAAGGLFPGLTEGLNSMESLLPKVERIVAAVSGELGSIGADAGASLASGRWSDFFDFLATDAPSALRDMATAAGNTAHAMAELWMAFDPLNDDFSTWLVNATADLDKWAAGLSKTDGFAEFMAYIEQTGPQVGATLGELANALLQIAEAAAPIGGPILAGIEAFAKAISAIADSDLGTPIFGAIAAFSALNLVMRTTAGLQKATFGGPLVAGIKNQRASISGLRADWTAYNAVTRTAEGRAQSTGAQMIASRAAAERLGTSLKTVGRTAGLVAGLAVATSGVADGMGLTNTASLALMGTMAGPYGAAIGGAAGLTLDLAHANDNAKTSIDNLNAAVNANDFDAINKNLDAVTKRVDDMSKITGVFDLFSDGLNALSRIPSGDFGGDKSLAAQSAGIGAINGRAAASSVASLALMARGFETTAAGARTASGSVTDFRNAVIAANAALTNQGSLDAYKTSLLDARDAIKENGDVLQKNGDTIKAHTRAGLANRAALRQTASSALEYAGAIKNADRKMQFIDSARDDFVRLAKSMGLAPPAARKMADSFGLVDQGAKTGAQSVAELQDKIKGLKSKIVEAKEKGAKESTPRVQKLRAEIAKLKSKTVDAKEKGASESRARVQNLKQSIDGLRDKTVTVRVNKVGSAAFSAGAGFLPGVSADGSTVPKTGRPYADRHPYLLADGEEVISNRNGQADRNRPLLKAINAGRLAGGGTAGVSNFAGLNGSVTVVFPAPAVLNAAVVAAEKIAAAGAKTKISAQDLRDVRLTDLRTQQQIRDIQKSLTEREEKTVGKGKRRHEVSGNLSLMGLDRTAAWAELANAKAQLIEQRRLNAVAATIAEARSEAIDKLREQRTDTTKTLSDSGDIFARGSSATSAITQVNRTIADITSYGQVAAALKSKGASPALLAQVAAKAESGDFKSAVRLGKALLAQPALLGQLNASLSTLGSVSANVAALTTDPRFMSSSGWNPTGQAVSTKQATVVIDADPSSWMNELRRQVTHDVTTALAGG